MSKSSVMIAFALSEVMTGLGLVHVLRPHLTVGALIGSVLCAIGLHALGLAQHESFHRLLFPSSRFNDAMGRFLCSWVLFTSFADMKRTHLAHHRNFGQKDDPDQWHWDENQGLSQSWKLMLKILLFRRVWGSFRTTVPGRRGPTFRHELFWIAAVQLTILLLILLVFDLGTYLLGWIFPLFSLMPLVEHVRVTAEHRQSRLRVFTASNVIERWIFGRFGFAAHGIHHVYPRVRWQDLAECVSPEELDSTGVVSSQSWFREFARTLR
jgi:fatty acid desaturase